MNKVFKKSIFLFFLIILFIFIFYLTFNNSSTEKEDKKIKIATCPTFFQFFIDNDYDDFEVILKSSSGEAISLLNNEQVDFALAGRVAKTNESNLNSVILKENFSFLSNNEISVYDYNLVNYSFYTDLELDTVKREFDIINLVKVDNVYNYLDKGIVITSWENTDLRFAEIVHVLKADNSRNIKSRAPVLFCKNTCDLDLTNILKSIIDI